MGSRETDALVAQKIFGKTSCLCCHGCTCDIHDGPHYSGILEESMKVFDRMRELGHRWLLNADEMGFHLRRVACVTRDLERDEKKYTVDLPLGTAKTLKDLPPVICEAALQSLENVKVS